jgi:hypothetical protein
VNVTIIKTGIIIIVIIIIFIIIIAQHQGIPPFVYFTVWFYLHHKYVFGAVFHIL